MKTSPRNAAFTLIEMITVMAVIVILTGLVLSVNTLVQKKGATSRASSEIATMSLFMENYKADNGDYPRVPGQTEPATSEIVIDPRLHGSPASTDLTRYQTSCQALYVALSGDVNLTQQPTQKNYASDFFQANRLKFDSTNSATRKVLYIQDPFGNCYGYSTAGAKAEQDYREALRLSATAQRPTKLQGYNPNFDLWSTAGLNTSTVAGTAAGDSDRNRWIKNW